MWTAKYQPGERNSFPTTKAEFKKIFADFVNITESGSNMFLPTENSFFADKAFTKPVTMPTDAGKYTVYVKMSNSTMLSEIQYTSTGKSVYLYSSSSMGGVGSISELNSEYDITLGEHYGKTFSITANLFIITTQRFPILYFILQSLSNHC